jgi:hypothetical protein
MKRAMSSRFFVMILLVACGAPQAAMAMFPLNLFRPWDINLRPPVWHDTRFQLTDWGEFGLHARGYNAEGRTVPVTQIWTPTQNGLAMFKGFGPDSPLTNFFINVLGDPVENGIRGNFIVTSEFNASTFGFAARYHAPHHFTIGVHFPFYVMSLKNVQFRDLTQELTAEDIVIKNNLTNNFLAVVQQFDPTLDLTGWKRMGFGDIVFMVEWLRDFYQGRETLKSVILNARGGITIPTGGTVDQNKILSVPFGFDGSVGVVVGGGLMVNWWNHVRGGFDAEFIHLFGNKRLRRIKVSPDQTDFLFFAKAPVLREYGFTQRFDIHLDFYGIMNSGLWIGAAYQYWRHDDDRYAVDSNLYSESIANTAQQLEGWTMNHLIFKLGYDFQTMVCDDNFFKPQLSLFYKMPIVGTRCILENTIGGTFSVSF